MWRRLSIPYLTLASRVLWCACSCCYYLVCLRLPSYMALRGDLMAMKVKFSLFLIPKPKVQPFLHERRRHRSHSLLIFLLPLHLLPSVQHLSSSLLWRRYMPCNVRDDEELKSSYRSASCTCSLNNNSIIYKSRVVGRGGKAPSTTSRRRSLSNANHCKISVI